MDDPFASPETGRTFVRPAPGGFGAARSQAEAAPPTL